MENLKKQKEQSFFHFRKKANIPENFLTSWKRFVFNQYFPFIFEMAEKSHFVNHRFTKKGVVPFDRFTDQDDIEEAIKNKQILVSLYKAPDWFAKRYHQLNENEKNDPELSDYLFICYNSTEEDGKKVTVSLHIMKKPQNVLNAELDYKQPFTKMTVFVALFALVGILLNLTDFFNVHFSISIGPLLILLSFIYIMKDVFEMFENILNGSLNKLISRHKKSMRRRLNSTHSLVYLESFNRRIDSSIAFTILEILEKYPDKMYFNDSSLLRLAQKNIDESITSHQLNFILSTMVDRNIIRIYEHMEIKVLLEKEFLQNIRFLSQKLFSIFDLPIDLQQELYELYVEFRSLVFDICSIAKLNPPSFPECK